MEKTIEHKAHFCDVCGKPVEDWGFIVVHGPAGDILYESKIVGDYCETHAEHLLLAVIQRIPLHERYDRVTDEKAAIRKEKRLIKKWEEDHDL